MTEKKGKSTKYWCNRNRSSPFRFHSMIYIFYNEYEKVKSISFYFQCLVDFLAFSHSIHEAASQNLHHSETNKMYTDNKILNGSKAHYNNLMLLISDGLIQDTVAFGFMFLNFDKYGMCIEMT